jgi:hypothetical protein
MKQPLHVIYVPGIGDHKLTGQDNAVDAWHWWGVTPEMFVMLWKDDQPWKVKFDRLLARVDTLHAEGKQVGLVGVSAGASAVINAYAARKDKIVGCVLIAGKVNHPESIGDFYRRHDPSFVESAYACAQALETLSADDRKRVQSRYALIDGRVARRDSRIQGARNVLVPAIGHTVAIAQQITMNAPFVLRFLKKQSRLL